MKLEREVKETITIESENLKLEDLTINKKKYSLEITNDSDKLVFDFNKGDYEIIIDEDGIGFRRRLYRPDHDHDDIEDLQIVRDPKKLSQKFKKGELVWRKVFPDKDSGCEIFYVPFGKISY